MSFYGISIVEMPNNLAFDKEADLVEWAQKSMCQFQIMTKPQQSIDKLPGW